VGERCKSGISTRAVKVIATWLEEATTEIRGPVSATMTTSLESLVGLKWFDGPDMRPTLLRVLTDLYVQKPSHTAEEEEQYVELSLRLLDAVDLRARMEAARKLATYEGAPPAVLRRLVVDGPALIEAEIQRGRVAAGPGTGGDPASDDNLVDVACELNELFFGASPAERRLIMINLDYSNAAQADQPSNIPGANSALEAAALQGRLDEFIRELERMLKVSRKHAQRIVNDLSGEPLVVAARALAMPIDILQRILLCVNPAIGHSVRRVYALTALYKDMSPASAWRLVAIWRAASPLARTGVDHQPLLHDSRSVRDVAIPRRASSRGEPGQRLRYHVTR